MENIFEQQVFYGDTDAYGVVWHGAYLRWLEMGRVCLCEDLGLSVSKMREKDILFPVTNLSMKYKSSARLDDKVIIKTKISKLSKLSVTFEQEIIDKETEKTRILATFDVVAINNDGKLYRRMPEDVITLFEKALEG